MITITERICAPLLVHFVLESALDYGPIEDVDGRLACSSRGEARWAVAWCNSSPAGIACLVTLDNGAYQSYQCLYWLEVLPAFQGQGIGQALLAWAIAQTEGKSLLIVAT